MHIERRLETSGNEFLTERHAEIRNGFASSPKSIILKAGNKFNAYGFVFSHDNNDNNNNNNNNNNNEFLLEEYYFLLKFKEFIFLLLL